MTAFSDRALFRGSASSGVSCSIAAGASLVCHYLALLRFTVSLPGLSLPAGFVGQFHLLLGASGALSILVALFLLLGLSLAFRFIALMLQTLAFALITIALANHLLISFFLLSALIIESSLLFEFPMAAWMTFALFAITVACQRPVSAWAAVRASPELHDSATVVLFSLLEALVLTFLGFSLKRLREANKTVDTLNHAVAGLTDANIGFQKYASSVEAESAKEERKRITREIHDTIGYALTNVMMMMEAASDLSEACSQELRGIVEQARREAQSALAETRRSLHELRQFEQGEEIYDLASICKTVKAFEAATGIRVHVELTNISGEMSNETGLAMFRMVQEAMTNSFRHGKAAEIWMHFRRDERGIFVRIRDDGKGGLAPKEGIGLSGMRERIERLGGRLAYGGGASGFVLDAWLPEEGRPNEQNTTLAGR